jgi:dihydrofolate synthase/folylpolyglutamate synthase
LSSILAPAPLKPAGPPAAPARLRARRPTRADDLAGWLAFAEALHAQTIDMGLERVSAVRDALGLVPDFPVITVAGTNGKGSTCALLAATLQAAGHRVGLYTSPHLVRYNERIRVDGQPVGDAALAAAYSRVDAARGDTPLTPFEFGTLAAMCVFVEAGLDAAVLEVGLGGRLDAVNAFDADCVIITSIGIDHVEYLGDTVEAIGREKAGVLRHGRPAICAQSEAPASIDREAARIGAKLLRKGRDYAVRRTGTTWTLSRRGKADIEGLPLPSLTGDFQLDNAAAALMALDTLASRLPIDPVHRHRGLTQARLAARFQRLRLRESGPEIVLDIAHNPHAAQRLAINLDQHPVAGRTFAVFAMLRDKDITGTARAVGRRVDEWFIGGIAERRGSTPAEVGAALDVAALDTPIHVATTPVEAFERALAVASRGDRVLVFGSFSTVGAVMQSLSIDADTPLR